MRRRLLVVIAILCFALPYLVAQEKTGTPGKNPCATATTQSDLNDCSCNEYKKADVELNRIYQELLAANTNDKVFVDKLKTAQRAWIAFRDAQLAAIYPDTANPRAKYGSVYTMCYCSAQQDLTNERTEHLKRMLHTSEGDVCGWNVH